MRITPSSESIYHKSCNTPRKRMLSQRFHHQKFPLHSALTSPSPYPLSSQFSAASAVSQWIASSTRLTSPFVWSVTSKVQAKLLCFPLWHICLLVALAPGA